MKSCKIWLSGIIISVFLAIIAVSCTENESETYVLPLPRTIMPIEDVITNPYLLLMFDTLYDGDDPPVLVNEGYVADPYILTYSSVASDTMLYGEPFEPKYFRFKNQTLDNTLYYEAKQGTEYTSVQAGYIRGSGDNFTVYFEETRTEEDGTELITQTIMTGTKTSAGIANLKSAFIIVKGPYVPGTPQNTTSRMFVDGDGVAVNCNW